MQYSSTYYGTNSPLSINIRPSLSTKQLDNHRSVIIVSNNGNELRTTSYGYLKCIVYDDDVM